MAQFVAVVTELVAYISGSASDTVAVCVYVYLAGFKYTVIIIYTTGKKDV